MMPMPHRRATMIIFALLLIDSLIGRIGANTETRTVPNTYDLLNLVYKLCVVDSDARLEGIDCVDYHLGAEVSKSFVKCMNKGKESEVTEQVTTVADAITELCDNSTTINEWKTKHLEPPYPITKVVGLVALQHIACVLEDIQKPFLSWQVASTKCFIHVQSSPRKAKSSIPQEQNLGR